MGMKRLKMDPHRTPTTLVETQNRTQGKQSMHRIRRTNILLLVFPLGLLGFSSGCAVVDTYRANVHIHRGQALLAEEDLAAALAEFEAAARIAPEMAVAHSHLGTLYRRLGDLEKAVDAFVEAIRYNPSSFEDTFSLAQIYHLLNKGRQAIQAYLHAVRLRPYDFDAQLNLGVCYQKAGEFDQAAERFQKAIEIDPQRPHAFVNLGVVREAQDRPYEAIHAYKEALERDGVQPLVLVNLAQTYMRQQRLKMARSVLLQAARLDPELAAAHQALGYCLFRMKDFDQAERSYQQALAYERNLPQSHVGLGSINMLRFLKDRTRVDRRDVALNHWHQSLEINPNQPKIHKLIARYQPSRDNPDAALLGAADEP